MFRGYFVFSLALQMILQEELPPCPANSDHFYGETSSVSSQSLSLDAPGSLFASSPNRNGQNSSQNEAGISCSPLLLSNLLQEPPSPKTLEQEVQASEENQTKPKTNILEALAAVLKRTRGTEKDKEKKKLQKKEGTQSFKRKRSRETKLMSTAEQFLEPTKKKQLKSPNVEGIFRDTMPQVQKSPASNNQAGGTLGRKRRDGNGATGVESHKKKQESQNKLGATV